VLAVTLSTRGLILNRRYGVGPQRSLLGEARTRGGLSGRDDGGLLSERLKDFNGPSLSHSGSEFDQARSQLFLAERSELRGRRISLEQIQHGRIIQMRPRNTLERRMDLRQQAGDSIAGLRDLSTRARQVCGTDQAT
jgi:hypothetical protein